MHFKDYLLRPKDPLVFSVSVSSLNLQSSPTNSKSSKFSLFFNSNEKIYTSTRWSIVKSYYEIKEFLKFLINDPKLRYDGSGSSRRGSSILQQHIPNEVSNKLTSIISMFPVDDVCSLNGDTQDVMELLQHKDNIDKTMQELMKYFNCISYSPLYQFLDCPIYMKDFLQKCVYKIQRFARSHFKKGNLNLCLYKHYQEELQEFVTLLEGGIPIYDVTEAVYHYNSSQNTYGFATRKSGSSNSSKMPCILWLDASHDDQALGRICIGTKDVFLSSRNNQDSRLANGIFLADIAAIRRGISSVALKKCKCQWLEPSLVVSIIGAERCLNFQLPRSSNIKRNHLIELLRLLAMQGLSESELYLRRRKWHRVYNDIPNLKKEIKQSDALRIINLFKKGILIEEEIYTHTVGSQPVQRLMLYNELNHTLSFTEVLDTNSDEADIVPTTDNVKSVNIDDIAEIRPGKFSYIIDGEELPLITIVSSEFVIALPVANISQRNGVLKKFQDFVLYLRDKTMDNTDTPKSFINQQNTAIFESSTSEKIENINGIEDIDMSTLSPTKSTTSNISTPVNTRHLSVSMTRSITQTRRNSNLLDGGRESREYDSFSRARESSMSNRSSISELEFIE